MSRLKCAFVMPLLVPDLKASIEKSVSSLMTLADLDGVSAHAASTDLRLQEIRGRK